MPAKQLSTAELQALIVSVPEYCANTVLTLSGQTFTATQLVALAQSVLDARTSLTAARASAKAALLAREKNIEASGELLQEARITVGVMFNGLPEPLSAFAVAPRKKPKPLSGEARAAATAKARATREARGTSSKKAKALITGNVSGVTITPVTAPVAPPHTAVNPPAEDGDAVIRP